MEGESIKKEGGGDWGGGRHERTEAQSDAVVSFNCIHFILGFIFLHLLFSDYIGYYSLISIVDLSLRQSRLQK